VSEELVALDGAELVGLDMQAAITNIEIAAAMRELVLTHS
jgi:hypothetical protein